MSKSESCSGARCALPLRSRGIYNNNNNQESSYDDAWAGWGAGAEASWNNVNTRAWIAGEFIWTGFDYIGEPTPYTWPSKSSYFGAIDTAYLPKDVFYFYQSKWNASGPTMVHIVPMNWTNWTAGQSVKVMVYTNAVSVELFLNDKSQGAKTMSAATGHLQWRGRRLAELTARRPGRDGVDCPACSRKTPSGPRNPVKRAAPTRSGPT